MAYFRATGGPGGGAGGATITVTYNSQFYDKTITCTKGSTTYTKITTSSGSTEFNVREEGTWTITCNGVSRQVDVVLEYTTQMAITKTITVYSAASDTVSFTDVTGAKTVTTNASGQGSVSITFIPPSQNITFTSSKAKNPNNLSQAYSKTITIDTNTTAIYVMPNKILYWWGYKSNNLEDCTSANGWTGYTMTGNTYNTNSVRITASSGTYANGVALKGTIPSGSSTAHVVATGVTQASNAYGSLKTIATKQVESSDGSYTNLSSSSLTYITLDISNKTGKYLEMGCASNRSFDLSAFWID